MTTDGIVRRQRDGEERGNVLAGATRDARAAGAAFFARVRAGGPAIMGILNVTPDSFSDGGLFAAPGAALAQAQKLVADGADIIDIGAESTRPGHSPISPELEWTRLEPALTIVLERAGAAVSVDTYKAETARRALHAGAAVINDVWGLQGDPGMAEVVAEARAGLVVMHNRHETDPTLDIVSDMLRFYERSLKLASRAGISDDRILLDPGVGFGKTREQNYDALRATPRLVALGFPVLIGVSRKSIFRDLPDGQASGRLVGTIAADIFAFGRGAAAFRVHDVAEHKAAFAVLQALREQ